MAIIKNWQIVFVFAILSHIQCIVNVEPTWKTSNYVKAASNKVIDYVLTGNGWVPKATIPFPGGAFLAIPNLGYGVSGYEGSY